MPLPGTKPKPDSQRRRRNAPTHDWVEIVDVPYTGDKPALGRAQAATRRWWAVVSSMPHCILWAEGDWQFAVDTARLHAAFIRGDMARATELRIREKQLGTTLDARRDLRIRYVAEVQREEVADVLSLADYRASIE